MLMRCPEISPHGAAPSEGVAVHVTCLQSDLDPEPDARQQADGEITDLLTEPPRLAETKDFAAEQRKDPDVKEIIDFIKQGTIPSVDKKPRRIAMQKSMFAMENGMLFYLDPRQEYRKRALFRIVSGNNSCSWRITHHRWEGTLRSKIRMEPSCSTDGGTACTATHKDSRPTVHSVPL